MDYPAYMLVIQVIFRPVKCSVLHISCNTKQNTVFKVKQGLLMHFEPSNAGKSAGNKQPNRVHD